MEQNLIDGLFKELVSQKLDHEFFLTGFFLRILAFLQEKDNFEIKSLRLNCSKEELIMNRIKFLLESSNDAITLNQIAHELHYNSDYLNQICKKLGDGETIHQVAMQVRLRKAKL